MSLGDSTQGMAMLDSYRLLLYLKLAAGEQKMAERWFGALASCLRY